MLFRSRTRTYFIVLTLTLGLLGCSSSSGNSDSASTEQAPSESAEAMSSDGADTDIESFDSDISVADLDQSFSAYLTCIEPDLDGYFRVNFDRYLAVDGDYGLPDGRDDFELAEEINDRCLASSKFDERISAFLENYSLSKDQALDIGNELGGCLDAVGSSDQAEQLRSELPETGDEVMSVAMDLMRPGQPRYQPDAVECINTVVYGSIIEF